MRVPFQTISVGTSSELSSSANGAQKHMGSVGILGGQNNAGHYSSSRYVFQNAIADSESPIISPISGFILQKNSPALLQAQVSDNTGIVSAKIFYRPITAPDIKAEFKSFSIIPDGSSNNAFLKVDVPDNMEWYDDMGMEYYFEVRDASNTSRMPAVGTYYQAYLRNPDAGIPSSNISFGKLATNFRIISVPYALDENSIRKALPDLGPIDKTRYRLYEFNNEENDFSEYANFTSINRGEGYFIILAENQNQIFGDGIEIDPPQQDAPSNHRGNLYQMTLEPGWNLIGNPYTVTINWNDVKIFNGNTQLNNLYTFEGSYTLEENLKPFTGAFSFVDGDEDVTIAIPFKGQASAQRKREKFSENIDDPAWRLNLIVNQNELSSSLSGFGMHPEASLYKDRFDDLNPPSLSSQAQIQFAHPEHILGNFCADIVPSGQEHVWRFSVETTGNAETTLVWNNDIGGNLFELYLFDVEKSVVIDMRRKNQYSFTPTESRSFKVYYGQNVQEKIGPDQVQVYPPYPNPLSRLKSATFNIGLPQNYISSPAILTIVNSIGYKVWERVLESNQQGIHSLSWSGTDDIGNSLPDGVYAYTVKAGARSFTGKIVLTH